MFESIMIGGGFAFAAAVQPGPLQVYLFSRVASVGWRRTLPAACAPLVSDGPIALLALLLLGRLSESMQGWLRIAGGVLLLVLAWRTWREWRRGPVAAETSDGTAPRSLLEAALVNVLNPNPYLGWTLIMGPAVVSAWRVEPARGVAVAASFYVVMVASLAVMIWAFGGARFLDERRRHALLVVSAVILLALGGYQLALGLGGLT